MKPNLRFPWPLFALFLLFAAGMGVFGYLSYENQKKQFVKAKESELLAIADLKVDEIVKWRIERVGDANVISQSQIVASKVKEWFENPNDVRLKEEIFSYLKSVHENYSYQNVALVDTAVNIRLASHDDVIGPGAKKLIEDSISAKRAILSDIYISALDGHPVRISLVAPLLIPKGNEVVSIGAVLLRIDPYQFLYPHISAWPVPSRSSETILVRRQNGEVLYLNELRHKEGKPLSFRAPVSRTELPSVMATQGRTGIVETVDYRGVPVVAALRPVPGADWFLEAKVDMDEIFEPLRERARIAAIFTTLATISFGLILGLIWRRSEAARLQKAHDRLETLVNERTVDLEQARRQNELILNAAGEGIYMVDPEGRIVFMNPAAVKMLGYELDEVKGRSSHDLFHHSKADGTPYPSGECGLHRTLVDSNVHYGSSEVLWRKNGTSFPVDFVTTPIKDGNNYGAVIIFKDISERIKAEEEKKKIADSLNEAQRMAHIGNWELRLVNDTLTWSDEIYRIFEIDPKQFGASYEAFLNFIHPDDRAKVDEVYTDSVKNHTPYEIEHRLILPDGRIKYVHERGETYYDQKGKPVRSIGTVQDITERKRAEEEKNKLNRELKLHIAQLEAANKELGAFSYNVSHDLRAPLRAIAGFSSIMMAEYSETLDEEGKRILGIIKNNAQRMGRLVDGLTEYLRLGRKEIVPAELNMRGLVDDVIEELRSSIPERNIEIDIRELVPCSGDRYMIKEVWLSLLSNAFKFTRPRERAAIEVGSLSPENLPASPFVKGGPDESPPLTKGEEGGFEEILKKENIYYVKDNGVGFDMRYEDKLFNVFQHLHGMDEFEGAGIGLAVVKRIIEKHGGKVWAEGKVGEGATFYFSLPKDR